MFLYIPVCSTVARFDHSVTMLLNLAHDARTMNENITPSEWVITFHAGPSITHPDS
jgi:hypothetical protein